MTTHPDAIVTQPWASCYKRNSQTWPQSQLMKAAAGCCFPSAIRCLLFAVQTFDVDGNSVPRLRQGSVQRLQAVLSF